MLVLPAGNRAAGNRTGIKVGTLSKLNTVPKLRSYCLLASFDHVGRRVVLTCYILQNYASDGSGETTTAGTTTSFYADPFAGLNAKWHSTSHVPDIGRQNNTVYRVSSHNQQCKS